MALSYNSVVPDGVAIRVMTSQSMVLSGEGANVSEITPKKLESPFLTFSVAPEELSVFTYTKRSNKTNKIKPQEAEIVTSYKV